MSDSLLLFYSSTHRQHNPVDHPETPERIEALLGAALAAGGHVRETIDWGLSPLLAVHSAGLLDFLSSAYERFSLLPEGPRPAIPDSFAVRQLAEYVAHSYIPHNIWGQLGHYCTDNLTPILPGTWPAAYEAAQVVLSAAAAVADGAPLAYGVCRPPGHHAYHDLYGGYCYLNNAAIAAQWLVERGRRPTILDIDYHHGNGTQAIFYERADVFFCSLHADPDEEYPYYCGFAHEIGRDEGEGYSLNLPLPPATEEAVYLRALEQAMNAIVDFQPDVLLVSLGFDTLAGDPQGGMGLQPASFRPIGRALAEARLPILLVQEGGYKVTALRSALIALLEGIAY